MRYFSGFVGKVRLPGCFLLYYLMSHLTIMQQLTYKVHPHKSLLHSFISIFRKIAHHPVLLISNIIILRNLYLILIIFQNQIIVNSFVNIPRTYLVEPCTCLVPIVALKDVLFNRSANVPRRTSYLPRQTLYLFLL